MEGRFIFLLLEDAAHRCVCYRFFVGARWNNYDDTGKRCGVHKHLR